MDSILEHWETSNTIAMQTQNTNRKSDISYNSGSANVLPTNSAPHMASSCGALKSALVQFLPTMPTLGIKPALSFFPFDSIPNLNPTSVTVTPMLMTISTMIIHVIVLILVSAMLSLRISASSKNTLQRSLRTLMRGVISRYSRIAKYSGWRVGSDSQKKFGTSRMLDATNG